MDNFSAIYKILNALEKSMDFDEFDGEAISAARLGVTENRRRAILRMLADSGCIEGVNFRFTVDGALPVGETLDNVPPLIYNKRREHRALLGKR